MNYFTREDSSKKSQHYKLKDIPNLVSPQKISQLNFSHNDIRGIPIHIVNAVNLQILDLSHNKIGKIEHIFKLTTLKFINFSHNLISEIPEQIIQLIEIENIDVGFNKISIMNNIKILKNLVELRTFRYNGFIEINL